MTRRTSEKRFGDAFRLYDAPYLRENTFLREEKTNATNATSASERLKALVRTE